MSDERTVLVIPKEKNRRNKLSDEQRVEILFKYQTGEYSTYKLAEEYNVSRRTIGFVLNPERYERQKELVRKNSKERKYYNKEKHAQYVRNTQRYRKQLMEKGELIEVVKKDD